MGRGKSISKPTNLTQEDRARIFDKTAAKVTKEYFDPNYNGTGWPGVHRSGGIPSWPSATLMPSSSGCTISYAASRRATPDFSINLSGAYLPGWQSVPVFAGRILPAWRGGWLRMCIEGGPAHAAGLKPLDVLETVNGAPISPPEQPMFPMGTQVELQVQRGAGIKPDVEVPWSPESFAAGIDNQLEAAINVVRGM